MQALGAETGGLLHAFILIFVFDFSRSERILKELIKLSEEPKTRINLWKLKVNYFRYSIKIYTLKVHSGYWNLDQLCIDAWFYKIALSNACNFVATSSLVRVLVVVDYNTAQSL